MIPRLIVLLMAAGLLCFAPGDQLMAGSENMDGSMCVDKFDLVRDIAKVEKKIPSYVAPNESVGSSINEVQSAILRYVQCRTIEERSPAPCEVLRNLTGIGTPAGNIKFCSKLYNQLRVPILWRNADSSSPLSKEELSLCASVLGSSSETTQCEEFRKLWKQRDSGGLCRLRTRNSPRDSQNCRTLYKRLSSDVFKKQPQENPSQYMHLYFTHHIWHQTRPDCHNDSLLESSNFLEQGLIQGGCVGLFMPNSCDTLLLPVKRFYCLSK